MRHSIKQTVKPFMVFIIALIISIGMISPVWADYPEKNINIIVGFKPGGITDSLARILAKAMQDHLGQPVIVINAPGGGGFLAASKIRKSPADGYNIAMTTSIAFSFMPHFMAKQKKASFAWDDFTYLATVGENQAAYVGGPDIKTWQDLLDIGKKKGKLSVAGMLPVDAMISRYISKKEGIPIKNAPFKGGTETLTAVMGGHTDFGFSGGLHIKYIQSGKLNTLAAFSGLGLAAEPGVPTLKSLGYDIDAGAALTLSLPKGTPDHIVKKLEDSLKKTVETPAYLELMSKLRMPVNYRGAKVTTQYISEQYLSMKDLFEFLK